MGAVSAAAEDWERAPSAVARDTRTSGRAIKRACQARFGTVGPFKRGRDRGNPGVIVGTHPGRRTNPIGSVPVQGPAPSDDASLPWPSALPDSNLTGAPIGSQS